MTYKITQTIHSDGSDTATTTWAGRDYEAKSANGSICKLARMLVSDGAPDDPWKAEFLSGPSLHRMACMTVSEGDAAPKYAPYAPHPKSEIAPALAAVLANAAEAKALTKIESIRARK